MKQQQEAALLAAYRLMNDNERDFHLEAFQDLTHGRANKKPQLQLIVNKPAKQ